MFDYLARILPFSTVLGLAAVSAPAQCHNVHLGTQAEVDSFSCTSLTGSLLVQGAGITNLRGLRGLTSVARGVEITRCPALSNLDGLDDLVSVGNYVLITHCDALTSLAALGNLGSVGASLRIIGNDVLPDLHGLEGVTSVGESVQVWGNAILTNVDGLSGLTTVGEDFHVVDNPALPNLDGFVGLRSIAEEVLIRGNAALTSLEGLRNLTQVGGYLWIESNPVLTAIDGLRGLAVFGGYVRIVNNPMLARFCGLHALYANAGSVLTTILGNAQNPTGAQILAAGACGFLAPAAPSNCEYGRELALTGSPTLGGTITATMSGHDGAPFVTWGLGQPVTVTAMCSSCKSLATLTTWQFTPTISTTIPVNPAFLGLPLMAQGLDLGGTAGQTCIAITPALWAFTAVHVATVGI